MVVEPPPRALGLVQHLADWSQGVVDHPRWQKWGWLARATPSYIYIYIYKYNFVTYFDLMKYIIVVACDYGEQQ